MRVRIIVLAGTLALIASAGPGAAATGKRSFSQAILGAQISASGNHSVSVYQIHDSLNGDGATVQRVTVTGTTFPLTGTYTDKTYFANGVSKGKGTFTLAAPDANGISALTGSGKCTGGTRRHRSERCTYTFSGTYDTASTITKATAKGTVRR
jgi:hypothetical protein